MKKHLEKNIFILEWDVYGTNISSTFDDVCWIRRVLTRFARLPKMGQLRQLFEIWSRRVRIIFCFVNFFIYHLTYVVNIIYYFYHYILLILFHTHNNLLLFCLCNNLFINIHSSVLYVI